MRSPLILVPWIPCIVGLAAACGSEPERTVDLDVTQAALLSASPASALSRQHVSDDVWHYAATLRVGPAAADVVRLHRVVRERSPWRPRATSGAAVLTHGDFSNCETNFLPADGPALALHLAQSDIDTWCVDRRWTQLPLETSDFSSLAGQGIGVAVADLRKALLVIRLARGIGSGDFGKLPLLGFSRGGVVAYATVAAESKLASFQRHVDGLVPLDVYFRTDDADMRALACQRHADQQALLAAGSFVADNTVFQALAGLALADPDGISPIFADGVTTNRQAFFIVAGSTFVVFPVTPWYHLAGVGESGFLYSSEERIRTWFESAVPWQALQEVDDGDALWCGETPAGVVGDLADVEVPVLYVGAAGGFGTRGEFTTTLVAGEVDEALVRFLPEGQELSDFGHGDLLFSPDAQPAWEQIVEWLKTH